MITFLPFHLHSDTEYLRSTAVDAEEYAERVEDFGSWLKMSGMPAGSASSPTKKRPVAAIEASQTSVDDYESEVPLTQESSAPESEPQIETTMVPNKLTAEEKLPRRLLMNAVRVHQHMASL